MFKLLKHFSMALVLGVVLPSCFKEFPITDGYQPRMVLMGVLAPGLEVRVHIGSTYPANDSARVIPLNSASVSLYTGSSLVGNLAYDSAGYYSLPVSVDIREGITYTIKASCEGYPPIEATTSIPAKQGITAKLLLVEVETINGPRTEQHLEVSIPAANFLSYYAVSQYRVYEFEKWDSVSQSTYISPGIEYLMVEDSSVDQFTEFFSSWGWCSNEPLPFWEHCYAEYRTYFSNDWQQSTGSKHGLFLSNEFFLDRGYTIKSNLGFYINTAYESSRCTHAVVYQLSPELYKAFRGLAAQESTRRSLFVSPVPAYNSIKGGLGYFGGCVVHTVELGDAR